MDNSPLIRESLGHYRIMCNEALLKQLISEIQDLKKILGQTSSPWMSIQEASEYLKLSQSALYKLVHQNKIPYTHIGNGQKSQIRFSRKRLDLWLVYNKTDGFSKRERDQLDKWI